MEERYIPRRLYHIASVITEADKRFQNSGQGGHERELTIEVTFHLHGGKA